MSWKSVRLELAENGDFPRGSASRAYLLRLPLKTDGRIDEQALSALPQRATVRRVWPSEADVNGNIVRKEGHWVLVGRTGETMGLIEPGEILPGALVRLRESGSERLFRVAALTDLERRRPL